MICICVKLYYARVNGLNTDEWGHYRLLQKN